MNQHLTNRYNVLGLPRSEPCWRVSGGQQGSSTTQIGSTLGEFGTYTSFQQSQRGMSGHEASLMSGLATSLTVEGTWQALGALFRCSDAEYIKYTETGRKPGICST